MVKKKKKLGNYNKYHKHTFRSTIIAVEILLKNIIIVIIMFIMTKNVIKKKTKAIMKPEIRK